MVRRPEIYTGKAAILKVVDKNMKKLSFFSRLFQFLINGGRIFDHISTIL